MKWVVFVNNDGTEYGMMLESQWRIAPKSLRHDVDGGPMTIIHKINAETYREAYEVYNDNMNNGFYRKLLLCLNTRARRT